MTQRSGTGDRRSESLLWRFFAGVLKKHMHDDLGEEAEYKYISQHKGLLFLLFFTVQAGEGVKAPQQADQTGIRHLRNWARGSGTSNRRKISRPIIHLL